MLFWFKHPDALKQALEPNLGPHFNQKLERLRKENAAQISQMIRMDEQQLD
jgi:predicted transposase YbfD/YdcC